MTKHCGHSGLAVSLDCGNDGTRSWQRHATADEARALRAKGLLPAHESEALVMVYACVDHAVAAGFAERIPVTDSPDLVAGTDLATVVHDSTCQAPAADPGDCVPCTTTIAPG